MIKADKISGFPCMIISRSTVFTDAKLFNVSVIMLILCSSSDTAVYSPLFLGCLASVGLPASSFASVLGLHIQLALNWPGLWMEMLFWLLYPNVGDDTGGK